MSTDSLAETPQSKNEGIDIDGNSDRGRWRDGTHWIWGALRERLFSMLDTSLKNEEKFWGQIPVIATESPNGDLSRVWYS